MIINTYSVYGVNATTITVEIDVSAGFKYFHVGLPDTVAARMMGHSVAIHTRTYHHWITRRDQQMAVDAALARRSA